MHYTLFLECNLTSLQGFCVKLEGPASQDYDVKYYARLHDLSLSPTVCNGVHSCMFSCFLIVLQELMLEAEEKLEV